MTSTMLEAALTYAKRLSFHVFPCYEILPDGSCACGNMQCRSPGKHPRTARGCLDATTDSATIVRWWHQWPAANIGIACGPSRIVVLDADLSRGGNESLLRLLERYGAYKTARAFTGGGGTHDLFLAPKGSLIRSRSNAFGDKFPGIDIKADGGYIIAAPSLHATGKRYQWGIQPTPFNLVELPRTWLEAIVAADPAQTHRSLPKVDANASARIPKGQRHDALTRHAGRLRRLGTSLEEIEDCLCSLNARRCDPPYIGAELEDELRGILKAAETWPTIEDVTGDNGALYSGISVDAFWQDSDPWPLLDEAAFCGPIGRAAKAISSQSEGDPVAILTTMLAAFGNAGGNGPHVRIGGQRHPARIFPCHVGITARGRKGQAFSDGIALIRITAPGWYDEAFTSGLGSGEGLLEKLARIQKARMPFLGSARALVYEPEFARLSAVAGRDGSTLSPILRDSFDRDRMEIATRHNAVVIDKAHVTIVAQSTPDELRRCITTSDVANGFANRFMFFVVRRSQFLPFGGMLHDGLMEALAQPLRDALGHAGALGAVGFAEEAENEWRRFYRSLDEGSGSGLAADLLARAEAHVLRLALIYALADANDTIRLDHLRAAQAVWKYSEASACHIFGDTLGDDIAQRILDELRAVFPQGLDRTAQHKLFQRHVPAARFAAAAKLLVDRGLATLVDEKTPGRTRTVLYAKPKKAPSGE